MSFGLSKEQANQKIGMLMQHANEPGFKFFRLQDVVYTANVAGKDTVEVHAMIGGPVKQTDKYRIDRLEKTLPNLLAILHQLEIKIVYVPMPKKEAKPYDGLMKKFGFEKHDIPENYGAPDMVAFIARLR